MVTQTRSKPEDSATGSGSGAPTDALELSIVIPCLNEVKTLGMTLDVTEQEGQVSRLRQGQGGPDVRVSALEGSVTVRPYDGSRLDLLVGGRSGN